MFYQYSAIASTSNAFQQCEYVCMDYPFHRLDQVTLCVRCFRTARSHFRRFDPKATHR